MKLSQRPVLLTPIAWQLKGDDDLCYALEPYSFICGAAVLQLRNEI